MERPFGLQGVVFVVVLCLSAGCVNAKGEQIVTQPEEPVAPAVVEVSDTRGGVEGAVVDDAVYPIGGANVSIEAASSREAPLQTVTTAADGAFRFSLLEPGPYRVSARHPEYGAGFAIVHVAAGEVAKATVILSEIAGTEPYALVYIKNGLMPCAFSYVAYADSCNIAGAFGTSKNSFRYNVTAGFQYFVVETDWQPTTATMDHDFLARNWTEDPDDEPEDWILVGRGFGVPILRVDFWPEKVYGTALDGQTKFPESTQSIEFRADTYYDGQYQYEINNALGPTVCGLMLLGYCTGAGVAFEHRFTQYTSIFMHATPPGLEEYSAVPDQ